MILAVYLEKSDTCGNTDSYGPLGYVEMNSVEEAEKIFTKGFLTSYRLEPVICSFPYSLLHQINIKDKEGKFR